MCDTSIRFKESVGEWVGAASDILSLSQTNQRARNWPLRETVSPLGNAGRGQLQGLRRRFGAGGTAHLSFMEALSVLHLGFMIFGVPIAPGNRGGNTQCLCCCEQGP